LWLVAPPKKKVDRRKKAKRGLSDYWIARGACLQLGIITPDAT